MFLLGGNNFKIISFQTYVKTGKTWVLVVNTAEYEPMAYTAVWYLKLHTRNQQQKCETDRKIERERNKDAENE